MYQLRFNITETVNEYRVWVNEIEKEVFIN